MLPRSRNTPLNTQCELAHGRGPAVDLATMRSFSFVFAWTPQLPLARHYVWNCFLFCTQLRQKQTPIKYGDQTHFLHKWKTDRTKLVNIIEITSASIYHTQLSFCRHHTNVHFHTYLHDLYLSAHKIFLTRRVSYIITSGVPRGGWEVQNPRNSEDIGGVLNRMSKKNRRLDFLL